MGYGGMREWWVLRRPIYLHPNLGDRPVRLPTLPTVILRPCLSYDFNVIIKIRYLCISCCICRLGGFGSVGNTPEGCGSDLPTCL